MNFQRGEARDGHHRLRLPRQGRPISHCSTTVSSLSPADVKLLQPPSTTPGGPTELPQKAPPQPEEQWKRWAAQVEHYLMRIEAVAKPDNFIIAGEASATFKYWSRP